MKKVQTKSRNPLICIFVLVILCGAICFFSTISYAQAAESEGIANLTEDQYSLTNTDNPNGIALTEYSTQNYGKNAPLSFENNKKKVTIISDDDIVKVVPEHLFKQVGITQHIGSEYGFFIETRKPFDDNEMLLSTVMLIDVTNYNDMYTEKSHLKIRLTPIFQADFSYVERGNSIIYSLQHQNYNFFKEEYKKDLEVEFPEFGTGFVIPIPTLNNFSKIEYLQHNKYYMTNALNQTSLYNVNHPNPYDDGYVAMDDMGCFFSQLEFNYDGIFLEKGKTNVEDVGSVVFNAASLAFDAYDKVKGLKSVFKAVPYVGAILTVADTINTIIEISNDLKDQKVSNERKISYTPNHNNKKHQIESGGGLRKDASMVITSNNEKQLLFGTNNYCEFDYQINIQDPSVDTRYAAMINIGIMSVINTNAHSTQFGQIHESTNVYSNELINNSDKEYKEIPNAEFEGITTENKMHVLPNCSSMIQLSPEYTGKYNIEIANEYAKFKIYEVSRLSNGILNYKDTSNLICKSQKTNEGLAKSEVELYKNKNYLLVADMQDKIETDHVYGRYGTMCLKFEFLPTLIDKGEQIDQSIQPGDTVVFEYDSQGVEAIDYSILSNKNVELEVSYGVLNNGYYWQSGANIFGSIISQGRKEYIKIKNTALDSQTVTVTVNEAAKLNAGETSTDILYTKAYSISYPYTLDVTLNLISEKSMYVEVYNGANEFVAGSMMVTVNKVDFTILANQKYFILIKQLHDINLSVSLDINFNITKLGNVYNHFNKVEAGRVFAYRNDDFSGDYKITTELDFKIYNDQHAVVDKNSDGSYTLLKNSNYYFLILEQRQQCNINFNIVSTTERSGVFPDCGVVFIKFIPTESGNYKISGTESYFWFNENLEKRYGGLNANETYYLMIEGSAAESYCIDISRITEQRTQIPLMMGVERNAGQYYFVIEQQGNYSFKTFRNSDIVESNITIYDEVGQNYCTETCVDFNTLVLSLLPGKYYLDLQVTPVQDTVTIRISKKR